jgi:hypothetical protein
MNEKITIPIRNAFDAITARAKVREFARIGIEVICVIPDATNYQFPAETFKNIRWLVDEFTTETLPSNEMQIALIQWAPLPEGRLQ